MIFPKSKKELEIPNYNLFELAQLEGLSVRTINTCKRYHLNNLEKILRYFYIETKKFKRMRNCVSQSVNELEGLCEKYGNSIINPILNNSSINKIDALSVKQKALFNGLVRYRFSTLSVRSSDAIKTYIGSDIGIQGVKFILSDSPKTIKNIRDLGINTVCEINDFINSFNEIIDKIYNYSDIDGIFVKLFKKAKLFDVCIEHLKSTENVNPRSLNICIENKMQNLQSIVIYFWAYDDFLKLKNCGQKLNLELIELCRKYELTVRKSIVKIFGKTPNKSFIQKINDY